MKNIKKILLFLVVLGGLLSFSNVNAALGTYSQNMSVSRHGSSVNQQINTPPFGSEKQVYSVNVSGTYDGHGAFGPSGGKYGISVCISNTGSMWNGSCWNVVDPNGAGNIGDANGNIPNTTVGIGNTSNDFYYVGANVYVNDADANVTFTMYGREVSINGFNSTSYSPGVGQAFDVTWNATERTANTVLTYSGPVSCDWASGDSSGNDTDGTTCTGTIAGTATFNLQARGYGAYGDKTVTANPITVNIIQPPISCGNTVREGTEACDDGPNNGSCPRTCSNACVVNSCSTGGILPPPPPPGPSTVNISLTVNGPGTVGTNLVPGRFGPGAYSGTIYTNTFVQFDVIPNPGEASSWTWGGPCSFFNSPLSSVCAGNATVNTANVVTFIPIPVTGTLTPANSSCTIPAGQSGCYSPVLTWSTSGFTNGVVSTVTSSTGVPASVTGNSGSATFYVPHNPGDPANEFYLSNNGTTLATAVVNTSCAAGTVWSAGACNIVSNPEIQSLSINSGSVTPNGSTQYTITVEGKDIGGGNKIEKAYALINLAGTNAGQYRGWLVWNKTNDFPTAKSNKACSGAGFGGILSIAPWDTYGHGYISDIVSCSSTVFGNVRTTTFVVRFDPSFTSPLTNNDIAGTVANSDGNWMSNYDAGMFPWKNYDLNFSLNMPTVSVDINPTSVLADNTTQYTVSAVGTDLSGGSNLTQLYALINQFGANAGQYRGYLKWGVSDWWPSAKNSRPCINTLTGNTTGGGYAGIQNAGSGNPGFGDAYMNLLSCSVTVSGNTRTVNFVVRFDPSFATPATGDQFGGHAYNSFGHASGWIPSAIFDLTSAPAPVVSLSASPTSVASGGSSTLTWTVSGATSCTASGGWSGAKTSTGGSQSTGAIASTQTYNLSCTGPGGTTAATPVTVTVSGAPVVTLTASPNPVTSGNSTTLTWTVSGATSCSNVGANAIPAGNWSTAGNGNVSSGAIASARTYRLSCTGPGGTTLSSSVTVNVSATPSLTVTSSTTVAPSGNVIVDFANVPTPTTRDWIGSFLTTAPLGSTEIGFIYTSSCIITPPTPTPTNGTCTFAMPPTPGLYELRLLPNDQYSPTLAISIPITVSSPSTYTLTVVATSSLGGKVTGTGIDCGADCTEDVARDSVIRLTAVPTSSYWRFTGWSGACAGTSTICDVTVSSNPTNVTATFVPRSFIYKEF